ncbi:MAG: electron transport complex subunit E [Candidatus Omnitrophota bacterium]
MSKAAKPRLINDFLYGILTGNPVLVLMIGLCPVLAVSTSVFNAVGMSIAFTFVLFFSNLTVSLLRKFTPDEIRIPVFIIVISTFVTIIDYLVRAYSPELQKQLGVFLPLIVVNCIIIARAEAFAYKNTVVSSVLDAFGTSVGFLIVMVAISVIREFLGNGGLFSKIIMDKPVLFMIMPPGGFVTIGLLMGILNHLKLKKQEK